MVEIEQKHEFLTEEEEKAALAARRSSKTSPEPPEHLRVGRIGEELACRYLWRRGFRVLERGFRGDRGEIDLIAEKRGRIHFVEVKTRTSESLGAPQERVDRKKRESLRETARLYLSAFRDAPQAGSQFDVLGQVLDEHGRPKEQIFYENAF